MAEARAKEQLTASTRVVTAELIKHRTVKVKPSPATVKLLKREMKFVTRKVEQKPMLSTDMMAVRYAIVKVPHTETMWL